MRLSALALLSLLILGSLNAAPDVACGNLSVADSLYTLNESVQINGSTCMNITANNVTLDCAGFSITGNNSTGTYGIANNGSAHNVNITNCNIGNFTAAIYWIVATSNATITNNNLSTTQTGGGTVGLYMQFTNSAGGNSVIDRNTILIPKAGSGNGVILYNGLGNTNFTNNVVLSNATGYYAVDFNQVRTGNYIFNNTVSGVFGIELWVVYAPYTGIGVINNTVNATTQAGINIRSTQSTPIRGNIVRTT